MLGNDTDPNGNAITAVLVSGPSNGTLTLNSNGSFTYQPNPNFNGTDSFTYKANDGWADSNVVTVTINVAPVDDPVVFVLESQSLQVTQGTTSQVNIAIRNPDSIAHQVTALSVVNPVVDILVNFDTTSAGQTLPRSIAAGQTINAVLVVNATNAINSQVDVTGLLQSTATPSSDQTQISIFVVPAGVPPQPDLKVSIGGNFTPINPAPGTSVTIGASVANLGTAASAATTASFLVFNTATGTNVELGQVAVPPLAAGADFQVIYLWNTSNPYPFPSNPGTYLVSVVVDPANTIAELSETNNKSSQLLQVGTVPVVNAYIEVQASVGLVCGPLPVSGIARYALPGQNTTLYYPVQGGMVTVRVKRVSDGQVIQTVTGYHTDVEGRYRVPISPPTVDVYVEVEVSDTGFAGTKVLTLPASLVPPPGSCTAPPPGGSGGYGGGGGGGGGGTPIFRDLFVFSEDIQFSNNSPAPGQTINVRALIHFYGNTPVYDVPVVVNAYAPSGGSLQKTEIGRSVVSFPNAGAGGPALVSLDWTNPGAAPYIIQVEILPAFSQFELNDKATRAIFVGVPSTTISIILEGTPYTACGGAFSASYTIKYAIVSGSQTLYFPVQGGKFTVSRRDSVTGVSYGQSVSHTSTAGAMYIGLQSLGAVAVTTRIEVTDVTLLYSNEWLTPACVITPGTPAPGSPPPPPPPPGQPPAPVQDVYVFSENIAFSNSNPALGETIAIFAQINYYGTPAANNIPVTINEILPVGDTLQTFEIGSTTVSFPNGGTDSPAFVIMNWKNTSAGARIIQVVVSPSFVQYTGNDKATRLIFVGNPSMQDSDGDGIVDLNDNCPVTANANQLDSDADGKGNACDPVAANDAYSVVEDGVLSIAAPGLLVNDTQAGGSALVALFVTGPTNGSIVFNTDGSFTYTPSANLSGADSFT
ncbi:MAG: tandem-95 repeat protein [Chloroflexi bacterium]|nr:tandem-95 repeat protein [Chloroflexota bacterium]